MDAFLSEILRPLTDEIRNVSTKIEELQVQKREADDRTRARLSEDIQILQTQFTTLVQARTQVQLSLAAAPQPPAAPPGPTQQGAGSSGV